MKPRRKFKKDSNHDDIILGLTNAGYQVDDRSRVGNGEFDLVVWAKNAGVYSLPVFVEIKTPEAFRRKDCGLEKTELEWINSHPRAIKLVADNLLSILNFMGVIDQIVILVRR